MCVSKLRVVEDLKSGGMQAQFIGFEFAIRLFDSGLSSGY